MKIIGTIIVVVLIALGIYFLVSHKNMSGTSTGKNAVSIKELMARNEPLSCTFVRDQAGTRVNGSIVVYNQDVRGDFDIEGGPSGSFASHFIVKDGTSYIWTSLAPIGFKKPVAKTSGTSASPEDQASIVGINDKVDYSCTPWNADLTRFNLPSGITFSDLPS
jgi:hypothetical protein